MEAVSLSHSDGEVARGDGREAARLAFAEMMARWRDDLRRFDEPVFPWN